MKSVLLIFLLLVSLIATSQSLFRLESLGGNITVQISIKDTLKYSVSIENTPVISNAHAAMKLSAGEWLGVNNKLKRISKRSVNEVIENPVPFKRKLIPDHYNELTIEFKNQFEVQFRVYDDGVAYRFKTSKKDSITVVKEISTFDFTDGGTVYWPEVQKREDCDIYHTSFEEPYKILPVSEVKSTSMAFSPVLVDVGKAKILLTESDLLDYPGMFLKGSKGKILQGEFAAYPDQEIVQGGEFKQWVVKSRKPYIAKTKGARTFPWRVIGIAQQDKDLLMNDIVYRLASPPAQKDWSWVKPGISTEEWINGINLHGIDFKAGYNTASYKYYIDFAADAGLDYVMLDAGWSDVNDLFKITPGMDLKEIAAYAKSKNISLVMWTLAMTLDRQLEEALKMFSELNVAVVMTDFMDRDDQKMVNFYSRVAEATARYKMMTMFHGAFKSAGFERTWPNAVTREGVIGTEYNIWSDKANPEHDLLIPFIRMSSGVMDYEPGLMSNANKDSFKSSRDLVMSQGTRAHQLAMFIVYESPLQLFCGNPSDAWKEKGFMKFLVSFPTTWDETIVLDAKLGDYILVARRKDSEWFIAALGDWTPREFKVDLGFLGEGEFDVTTVMDGINAEKYPADYTINKLSISRKDELNVQMAPGGGYVAHLTPHKY
ncbi:MAG TPA: glycoside hydrolase family 97 protein [Cyclobacteriaceae bacterium]|nr:glycoside hydrolase family 97 protein [Cyclobacteriaceae bacterium]HMV11250.1 glycoside hydrolase family 97 protein [Cyclobacteriaceae bacterium]HMV88595.1 glycoside hydrolase family 97 protein [Cyclobacteriaceae bacterium]HMX00643.1 glycoside hydrolase family 97 protein [Cyclobacteriaceae bacterium]HMX49482.1 glycoside hydrolase family 97 protein [Cyclobacteriaceae bacterium]